MKKVFLIVIIMLLPFLTNKQVIAKDLSNNIGFSLYGGPNIPTNGNFETGVKSTDVLNVGPQFGLGLSYFFTDNIGTEILLNGGYNFFKDKYKGGLKDPVLIIPSLSINGVYNFGKIADNFPVTTLVRAGVGAYNWSHVEDGNDDKVIKMGDVEHKGISFGFNVGLGVEYIVLTNFAVSIIVDYNMYFPKDEAKFGKDFAKQGYLTPQLKLSYYLPVK